MSLLRKSESLTRRDLRFRGCQANGGRKVTNCNAQRTPLCTKLRTAKGADMNRKLLRRMTLPLIAVCLVLADCKGSSTTGPGPTTAFAVLRLNTADGSPDTSFAGGRGIAITDIDSGLFDFAIAVAVQANNKILAAGRSGLAGPG